MLLASCIFYFSSFFADRFGMGKFRRVPLPRARERANLSFFIVIIFFAIFTVIVLTEIFLIDERGRNSMGLGSRGHRSPKNKHRNNHDYDEGQVIVQVFFFFNYYVVYKIKYVCLRFQVP